MIKKEKYIYRDLRILVFLTASFITLLSCATVGKKAEEKSSSEKFKVEKKKISKFYFNSKNGQTYVNKDARFSIRTVDSNVLDHIEVSIDSNKFEKYKGVIRFEKEGLHNLRFRSVDPVLNWSPIQSFNIYVDWTPPILKPYWEGVHEVSNGSMVITSSTKLNIEVQDYLSGVARILYKSKLNSMPKLYMGPLNFTARGKNTIYLMVVDNVENASNWTKVDFVVDVVPPKTAFKIVGKSQTSRGIVYINHDARIELLANDQDSEIKSTEYRLNKNVVTYKHPIALKSKENKLEYRSVDIVGNKEKFSAVKIVLDHDGPQISMKRLGTSIEDHGIIYAKGGFKFDVTAKDRESGLLELLVYSEKGQFERTKLRKFKFTKPGLHNFALRAIDRVGNVEQTGVFSIFIDNTVGVSQIRAKKALVPHNKVFLSSLPNSIDIIGKDEGVGISHIEYGYDGKKFVRLDKPIDLTLWKVKKRTLYYRGVDRLGNREPIQKITIRLQTQSPKIDLFIDSDSSPNIPLSKRIGTKSKVVKGKSGRKNMLGH